EKTNIITIEDPIEYQIPGVNQTQINDKIKLTFASALRSILRQDPDVILLGEIRDGETAKIAMQAAQTGHLVLSTLHTDDAPSVVTRLADIGAEPFVIASALVGVVAQRLVRRLCVHCRRQYTPPPDVLRALNIAEADAASIPFYKAVGCDQCNHTGYRGRIGIYEVMRVTDKLRRLIAARITEDCGRALQPGWNFCPYCAKSAAEPKKPPKRLRDRESRETRDGRRELPPANVAEFKK
ncbi:MAG: Flp pilus assembly complex ATPase component TadA, partial [Acidobacteria bacterium]|nr:Flp pilus assembly complex ATPase component TadA [Acidobacteriota bacterium]